MLKDDARMLRRLLAASGVPRPVRVLLAIAVLPIPGPFEEATGAVALWWPSRRAPALVGEHWNALRRESAPMATVGATGGALAPTSELAE